MNCSKGISDHYEGFLKEFFLLWNLKMGGWRKFSGGKFERLPWGNFKRKYGIFFGKF
jgi:hypothetical protein